MDYLLRGDSNTDDLLEDARAYNITIDGAVLEPEHYELWAEHVPAVDLFLRAGTQWRSLGEAVMGLDYGAVLQLAQLYDVPDLPRTLEDLQVMEIAARDRINDRIRRAR